MKKSKWDIIGKEIDKENTQYYDSWFYWWYDGEDYFDHDYGQYYTYDYIDTVYQDYVSKRGIRVTLERIQMGSYIDMMSIYPKSKLRQLKIDYLLGEDKWDVIKKTTLGDLYERCRNI
jgi:hypothetical protein